MATARSGCGAARRGLPRGYLERALEAFAFAPAEQVDLIEGTDIWLAVHASASINSRGSDGANQNDARRLITQSYAGGLPDPFGSGSSYNNTRGIKMLVWTNPT
jgi:hypothetical protein